MKDTNTNLKIKSKRCDGVADVGEMACIHANFDGIGLFGLSFLKARTRLVFVQQGKRLEGSKTKVAHRDALGGFFNPFIGLICEFNG